MLLLVNLGMILGGTGKCNVIDKKEKGNKKVRESEVNYTFINTGFIDIRTMMIEVDKTNSSIERI